MRCGEGMGWLRPAATKQIARSPGLQGHRILDKAGLKMVDSKRQAGALSQDEVIISDSMVQAASATILALVGATRLEACCYSAQELAEAVLRSALLSASASHQCP